MNERAAAPRSIIYLVFAVSGATALIYQVIWSRWLGLVFGCTTTSVSIVLGSFMLGLALGSWGAGRLLRRPLHPLRAYALMELGIGLFAIAFPLLASLAQSVFLSLVSTESPILLSLLVRSILAFLLLLVPTTLMGATLPFLTEFLARSAVSHRNWKVGLLYAANTFGAAVGVLAAGFLLIEWLGVHSTNLLAASFNLLVAGVAYRMAMGSPVALGQDSTPGTQETLTPAGRMALVVLAASGAVALGSEVLWTRALETLVGNSSYAFSMIVLLYLLGIAGGSWVASLIVNRLRDLTLWLAVTQLAMGLWILAALSLFDILIRSLEPYKGVLVPIPVMFWAFGKTMALLLPLSVFSGAVFPIATRILHSGEEARGRVIARAAAWNTAGAVAGSLLAGFLVAPFFDYFDAISLLALVYGLIALATILLTGDLQSRLRTAFGMAALLGVICGVGLAVKRLSGGDGYPRRFEARHWGYKVVYHHPGLQGVTSVIRFPKQELADSLLVNGMGMTIKVTDTKMMAHLPMMLHPDPKDTLVICFGMGTTFRSALSHGERVTAVELVKEVFSTFEFFHGDAASVRANPKGRMVVNDGRNFLRLTRDKYDIITIDPPPPIDAAGVNNLYSKEFIELARTRLKPGGIMAHWIPFPGRGAGVDDKESFNSLVATFADVFPYVIVKPGWNRVGLHVLGSDRSFEQPPEAVAARLNRSGVLADLREWDPVPPEYFRSFEALGPWWKEGQQIITDDRPSLEFYLLRTWMRGGKKEFIHNFW